MQLVQQKPTNSVDTLNKNKTQPAVGETVESCVAECKRMNHTPLWLDSK